MKKLIRTLALGAGLLLGLTGCDLYQPDVDSLLAPPVLSELQTEVDEALRDVVGQDLRLCYPAGGSYRSPYIFTDLDGDEEQEAVVFYTVEDEPLVYLQILDKSDGRWRARNALPGTEGEVLFVDFRHLSGDGATDLLVGWREPTGNLIPCTCTATGMLPSRRNFTSAAMAWPLPILTATAMKNS